MRRVIVVAAFSVCGGFCLASVSAFGYAKLNAWRDFGKDFQLGYVVGYLDAATLAKRRDPRATAAIPGTGKPQYERWRDMVNAFYEDPANAERSVPDAMAAVGAQVQAEVMRAHRERQDRAWAQRLAATPVPSPAAGTRPTERRTDGSGEDTPEPGAPTAAPGPR